MSEIVGSTHGVEGWTAPGWEGVADVFAANHEQGLELGSACSVYVDGRPVVDLWGGVADPRSGRPWTEDTVCVAFSTSKGATALCAHLLVERGLLDLDAPVTDYWPEYGAEGKDGTLVRWLLSHRAGVPAVDATLTAEELCAWEPVIRALERQRPFWPPGEAYLYHAVTYGFLVGELVRRATGKSLGAFFADEVARPLGLSTWIGTPAEADARNAWLALDPPPDDPEAVQRTVLERAGVAPESVPAVLEVMRELVADPLPPRTIDLGGALPDGLLEFNRPELRAAELPGSNIVTDARSVARMYAATVGDVDGMRLLRPETVAAASVVQIDGVPVFGAPAGLAAFEKLFELPFALGFMRPPAHVTWLGPRSFGHGGAGGSLAIADPDAAVAFGYVMNRLTTGGSDRRAARLLDAVRDRLDA